MICSVHQPNFSPYLGFFRKVLASDVFVLYDSAQYVKNDYCNRNRIKTQHGAEWLSVPVSVHLGDDFRHAKPTNSTFIQSHLGILKQNYRTAPYFDQIFPLIKAAYEQPYVSIADFNWNLLKTILGLLEMKTTIRFSSELNLGNAKSTEALVKICKEVGADTYISGADGPRYMNMELFNEAGITVKMNDFTAKPYPQQWAAVFMPNLSVLDALFNIGPAETKKLISA